MLSQRRRLKHQTCTLITAAVPLLGGSCAVWQPESGTSLSDTMTPIVFAGFVPAPSAASQKSQSMSRGEHATGVGPLEGASEVFVPVPGEAVDARLQGARAVERTVA